MDAARWRRGFRRCRGWLRSTQFAALVLVTWCPPEQCDSDEFYSSPDPLGYLAEVYGPMGKSTPVEVSRQVIGGPMSAQFNASLVATKDGFCFNYWDFPEETRKVFDADLSGGPSVKGVVLEGPRTRPTDDPYVDEIVEEYRDQPLGGRFTFRFPGAPGGILNLNGFFNYNVGLADASGGHVTIPICSNPPPPVAVITRLTGSETGNAGSSVRGLPLGQFEDDEASGIVVGDQYVIADVQKSTRASDEEIERWFEWSYRTLGLEAPRFDNWEMEGEDPIPTMVTEIRSDRVDLPPPAVKAPPPPPAGTGGLAEQFHSVYGSFRRQVDDVLEEGRSSCDYENGEGLATVISGWNAMARNLNYFNDIISSQDREPVCRRVPVLGSLFKGGTSSRSRMRVDVIGAGEEGMAQVPIDVLVDAGKVREGDGRRGEPTVVEIDRTDSDGQLTVPVDEFDVPEGTETVTFELNRTRNGLRERRVVLVPLTDDMSYEEAERRVREQYAGWEVEWLDGYLVWGAGEWYSLDLVRRWIHWTGFELWGDLGRRDFADYILHEIARRHDLALESDRRLMVIGGRAFNPFGLSGARTIPGIQQKFVYLDYWPFPDDEVELPTTRVVPGGGIRAPQTSPPGIPEIYLIDRGESTGESMEMVVVNANGQPIRFSGAVVVEPVELGPDARRRLEAALLDGRRVTVQAYCLQRDLGVPAKGTVMRIADRSVQRRFAFERRILYAARDARDSDRLHPNTSPESYFHSVLQWSLWTREKGYDRQEFEEAFVEHARENFAQAGREWNDEIERAVRALVPARWDDVQSILEDVES